jgi:hypothetical protein
MGSLMATYESSGPTITLRNRHLRRGRPVRDHMMRVREPVCGNKVDCQYAALSGILDSGDFSILSAFKSNLSAEENVKRHFDLAEILDLSGLHPIPLESSYRGEKEWAFLVPHLSEVVAREIAADFQQESIIHGHRLIGVASGETMLTFNPRNTIYGSKALEQESYSRNRQGTAFSLQP